MQYSSTCLCSAVTPAIDPRTVWLTSVNGEVKISEAKDWLGTEEGILATPDSWRSTAKIRALDPSQEDLLITDLINRVEGALKLLCKARLSEDEQEFVRLNGKNLMFVEHAGRRLKYALSDDKRLVISVRIDIAKAVCSRRGPLPSARKRYLPIP